MRNASVAPNPPMSQLAKVSSTLLASAPAGIKEFEPMTCSSRSGGPCIIILAVPSGARFSCIGKRLLGLRGSTRIAPSYTALKIALAEDSIRSSMPCASCPNQRPSRDKIYAAKALRRAARASERQPADQGFMSMRAAQERAARAEDELAARFDQIIRSMSNA